MKTLLIVVSLILAGCTTTSFLSRDENIWVAARTLGEDDIFFCEANRSDKGPAPICHEARMVPRPGHAIGLFAPRPNDRPVDVTRPKPNDTPAQKNVQP